MQGSILYVTCEPCYQCWVLIKGTPMEAVIYRNTDGTYTMKGLR